MRRKELVEKIVEICETSSSNYDSYDEILKLINKEIPDRKTKKVTNEVFISMKPMGENWRVTGVYDDYQFMKMDNGIDELTEDELDTILENNTFRYLTGKYHRKFLISDNNKLILDKDIDDMNNLK